MSTVDPKGAPTLPAITSCITHSLDICEARALIEADNPHDEASRKAWQSLGARTQKLRRSAHGACGPELRDELLNDRTRGWPTEAWWPMNGNERHDIIVRKRSRSTSRAPKPKNE